MRRFVALAGLAGALNVAACDGLGQAMTAHTDVVARAAGHELTVEQVVNLLAPATRIPAQSEVVQAIADLWTDYTLLAAAAAQDSTLANVDLDALVEPYFNQQLVYKLRDQVIAVDSIIPEDELRALYEREQPEATVRARHILLRLPPDASPQVRDSVTARAQRVLAEARGGADFASLAAQYSEEPGAADRGGDLGYFGRGQMVQEFEDAAFALNTGEISDLVQTAFGLHIIKVEDRQLPNYDDIRDSFHDMMVQQRFAEAEEQYLTQLTETKSVEVQEGAVDVARDLARKPTTQLGRRAAQRPLVRYRDGGLTAGEYMRMMQQRPAQQRAQIAAASDDQIREWLRLVARDELLIDEARRLGLETPQEEIDSARIEVRQQLREAAQEAGLTPITPEQGETQAQAIQRQVMSFLRAVINGEANVVPLGAIGFSLREQFGAELMERSIPVVVRRVELARPATGPDDVPMPPDTPQPDVPPTTGN